MRSEAILVVDDEDGIVVMLDNLLRREGYTHITKATSAAEALTAVRAVRFDMIVLDVMLPDMDGFTLCTEIRKTSNTPILFLTARSSDLDKLQGLYLGGDDYLTKPFNPLEVVARIHAHIRRSSIYASDSMNTEELYKFDRLTVNRTTGQLIVNDEEVPCPAKEFELLLYFCKHPNRVFTVQQLYEQVWGTMVDGDEKTVVIHISRLRKKLEADPSVSKLIVTLRGIGYKFVPPTRSLR
ncbi:response regulator transcription factor [Pseudalkalibacillus salsuginis]|uniref:response regulator transcription factor n=1 Tax=Pseudalkalibacillus salsuginis TaxID=2910972 RepID=UPI001F2F4295|nr:response regulator transcription factor [Pseudalkalibacillus salsuginis]MCF6411433.1 response regulator transcription factor [Pseudalkalibacillus salsuginis]